MQLTNDGINFIHYDQHLKGWGGRQETIPPSKTSAAVYDETRQVSLHSMHQFLRY
jgi:hypothetical protein